MKRKVLITIVLVTIITLIIISIVVIYFKNRNRNLNKDNNIYFPKDVYTPSKLSDEEYNKLSESIISKLEYEFGKEGGFEIKSIERGSLQIGDVSSPISYKKVEVYSKFLGETFDGQPSSFIDKLLYKYKNELNIKIHKINENMNVSIVSYPYSVKNYGHIPTLEEIPNEDYSILLYYYTNKNEKNLSNNIDEVINVLRTDLKEAYYVILENDSSYKNRNFEIRYVIENSVQIIISINPNDKVINLVGYNIEIPNKSFDWNEVF